MRIENNLINSTIQIPFSKSYINRNLILAALNDEKTTVSEISYSEDVIELVNGLKQIGLTVEQGSDSISIIESFPKIEKMHNHEVLQVQLGNGGTTFRFLLLLLALGEKSYEICLKPQLAKRNHTHLFEFLSSKGVFIEDQLEKEQLVKIRGPLKLELSDLEELDVSGTSQGISAIKLIYPTKREIQSYQPEMKFSQSYLKLTEKCVEKFLQNSTFLKNAYDHSSLPFFIIWGLLQQNITVLGITEFDPNQAEYKLIKQIYELFSTKPRFNKKGLITSVVKPTLKEVIEFDLSQAIDAIFPVILLSILFPATYKITNIRNLTFKEVDRLKGIFELFKTLKINFNYCEQNDLLTLFPFQIENIPDFLTIEALSDHRFIMLWYFILKYLGHGELKNTEHVSKSFPGFFDAVEPK